MASNPPIQGMISIIIPIYNEEATLAKVVERVQAVPIPGLEKEIILVNDGSQDHSAQEMERVRQAYPDIVRLHSSLINLGKGASVRLGVRLAQGEIIMVQDADLELFPEEIPLLVAPILTGQTRVVFGSRFLKKSNRVPMITRMANGFLTGLTNLLFGGHLTDMATAYKVFHCDVIQNLPLRSARFEFEPEVTAKLLAGKHKIIEVPITYEPRTSVGGKKIGAIDGIEYIYTLLKYRFFGR